MAKRLIDWVVKGSNLIMGKYIDVDTPSEELAKFDIAVLYPSFKEMNDVQQHLIVYGLKQKLADTGSSERDPIDKMDLAVKMFERFENGEFKAPATGGEAKENKRIANAGRATANLVSLEGLICKKNIFSDTFTEEDEEKLAEFMQMVSEHK